MMPRTLPVIRRFLRSPAAVIGVAILLLCTLAACLAPWLAHQNPYDLSELNIIDSLLPPGSPAESGHAYWLGTDDQGRDLYSAVLYGLRTSMLVAASSTALALCIGVVVGLICAYFGGRIDALLMRVVDLQLALPSILTALALMALLGPGLGKIIIAIVASQWAYFARTLRSSAMLENAKEYVLAARTLHYPAWRIMLRHILPNAVGPLGVVVVVELAAAVALEATLSFLGVGLPVTQPSLGLLIANGYTYLLAQQYWVSVVPGVVLLALLLGVNLVGERLRQLRQDDPSTMETP